MRGGFRLVKREQEENMEEKKFQEIIQFVLEKEIGTHDLYSRCSQIAKYSGAKELLEELATEEE